MFLDVHCHLYEPFFSEKEVKALVNEMNENEIKCVLVSETKTDFTTLTAIKKRHPEVELLRDANLDMLKEVANEVSAEDYIRAEFVIEEIQRLLDACAALEKGDYETVGKKMYETH